MRAAVRCHNRWFLRGYTSVAFPEKLNMGGYFLRRHVEEGKGSNVALRLRDPVTGTRCIKYGEVDISASKMGNVLKSLGINIEDRVLVCQRNCPELVYSIFGTLYVGGTVAMCPPTLPDEALWAHYLSYTEAKVAIIPASTVPLFQSLFASTMHRSAVRHLRFVLVTHNLNDDHTKALLRTIPDHDQVGVQFLDFDRCVTSASAELLPVQVSSNATATWFFTSGTTSLPKACLHAQTDIPYVSYACGCSHIFSHTFGCSHIFCSGRYACETYAREVMRISSSDVTATASVMTGPYAVQVMLIIHTLCR
jgi:acyl-coenzyme A synthetase/AMP-(fatty) acid ligase